MGVFNEIDQDVHNVVFGIGIFVLAIFAVVALGYTFISAFGGAAIFGL